jgi:hypothetical protein
MSTPLVKIPERLAGHVRVSEGIGLPIYWPIYRLGRPIFGRFRPVSTRRRRFFGRSTHRRALHPIPGRIRLLFTPPPRFSSAAYPPCPVYRLSHRLLPDDNRFSARRYRFWTPGWASAPLLTGANGERRIHSTAELGRPNTIYMSSGPSGHIFMFLIQFEFYSTKWLRFEKKISTNVLRISSSFYIFFLDFFIFFSKFLNFNSKNQRFLKSDPADPAEFR